MKSTFIASALLLSSLPAQAAAPVIDHEAIDRQIRAFTGVPAGAPGGAASPIDRRLRLSVCGDVAISWRLPRREALVVECRSGTTWKFFVPLAAGAPPIRASASEAAPTADPAGPVVIVAKGDVVTLQIRGGGFSVSQSGVAMEHGAAGAWIRVKPAGKADILTGRIVRAGLVSIPAS